MYRLLVVYLIASLVLLGCSSPLEKSVLEPLEPKELDKVAGEDNSFLATNSIVEGKWNYINTPQDSARWAPITYGRLHSYLKARQSAELNSPLLAGLGREWDEMDRRANISVDSIISDWKNFLADNSPDSLVSIVYQGAEFERIRNIGNKIDTLVKASIRLTALRHRIDSVKFSYSFADSLGSYISVDRRIDSTLVIKVYPTLPPSLKKIACSSDSTLQMQYRLHYVYSDGVAYNTDSSRQRIPEVVLAMIDYGVNPNFPSDSVHLRKMIIKELINPGYIHRSAYLRLNAQEYYRQTDSLVYSYLNFSGDL